MKTVKLLPVLAVALSSLTGCAVSNMVQRGETQRFTEQQTEYWAVETVEDGSNFVGRSEGSQEPIRLCGIAVPGLDHPLRESSRTKLEQLLGQSSDGTVGVVPVGRDPAGYLLAEVFVPTDKGEEIHVNSQLVLDGLAYVDQAVNDCPNSVVITGAEDQAKDAAVGLWEAEASE
ncbi:thermonuclease family protein [Nodosilinea sp. FACHB-131]|nr:thermonuclease family protein [Nodosilinea sp. FACHB-131]